MCRTSPPDRRVASCRLVSPDRFVFVLIALCQADVAKVVTFGPRRLDRCGFDVHVHPIQARVNADNFIHADLAVQRVISQFAATWNALAILQLAAKFIHADLAVQRVISQFASNDVERFGGFSVS